MPNDPTPHSGTRKKSTSPRTPVAGRVLDLDAYIPAYLTQLGNKWARSASHLYMRRFGVGVNEWRVMTIAAAEPGCRASRMCAILGMDKAAIGRSIQALEKKKLFKLLPDKNDGRSSFVSLTDAGWHLHEEILDVALAREKQLLTGFSAADTRLLISLLERLRTNLPKVNAG